MRQISLTGSICHAYERYLIERAIEQDVLQTSYSEGESKGRADKARQIARSMLAESVAPMLIARVTGLSAEEIAQLG